MSGYAGRRYAESLSEFGTPRELPCSRGWILRRSIPGSSFHDAIGCYPVFACEEWAALPDDLKRLENELVSLCIVTDPLGEYDPDELRDCFTDRVVPFKEHFVVDLSLPLEKSVTRHHRYYAGKSLRRGTVEIATSPSSLLDEWCLLYDELIQRHGIRSIPAFSRASFAKQLALPEMTLFRAREDGETTGIHLWIEAGNRVYHHLSAYSAQGYQSRTSYALLWYALHHFQKKGCSWASLGGNAGNSNQMDGLSMFKQGWSTSTRTVYLCGKIINRPRYDKLVNSTRTEGSDFFPAYRGHTIEGTLAATGEGR